jgi:hypothetical protein
LYDETAVQERANEMDRLKPIREVWKHRVIAGCFFSLHAVNCVVIFFGFSNALAQPNEFPFPLSYFPVFFLGILGSLYYIFDLAFFKWNYSKLGKSEAEIPKLSQPILVVSSSYGGVGLLRGSIPFFDWHVYPEGLKVRLMFVGEAFVKVEDMKSVSWSRLEHQSKTVRGPLMMPPRVASEVKGLLEN